MKQIDNYETKIQKNKTYKVEAETEYEIENISEPILNETPNSLKISICETTMCDNIFLFSSILYCI